jgi:hypothetical protein
VEVADGKVEDKEGVREGAAEATSRGQIRTPSNGEGGNQSTTWRTNRAWKRVKVEKEYGGMTAVNKTCAARMRIVATVKIYPFARDVGNTIMAGNGATRAKRKDSMLPGIGVTIGRVAHPWQVGLGDLLEHLRRPDSTTWGQLPKELKVSLARAQDWLDSAEAATELRNDTWWRADAS